jgi:hypothetical protein
LSDDEYNVCEAEQSDIDDDCSILSENQEVHDIHSKELFHFETYVDDNDIIFNEEFSRDEGVHMPACNIENAVLQEVLTVLTPGQSAGGVLSQQMPPSNIAIQFQGK